MMPFREAENSVCPSWGKSTSATPTSCRLNSASSCFLPRFHSRRTSSQWHVAKCRPSGLSGSSQTLTVRSSVPVASSHPQAEGAVGANACQPTTAGKHRELIDGPPSGLTNQGAPERWPLIAEGAIPNRADRPPKRSAHGAQAIPSCPRSPPCPTPYRQRSHLPCTTDWPSRATISESTRCRRRSG